MKKTLSIILAILIVLSTVPFAFATDCVHDYSGDQYCLGYYCGGCDDYYGEPGPYHWWVDTQCIICQETHEHKGGTQVCAGYMCDICYYFYGEGTGKHIGGTATCKELAKCEVCNQKYGDYNYNNHQEPETYHCMSGQNCIWCDEVLIEAVDSHTYDKNGFGCTVCDAEVYQSATETRGKYDVDGDGTVDSDLVVYEIKNAGQLYWFAEQVKRYSRTINGILLNDITVNENVLKDGKLNGDGSNFREWTPIGYYGSSSYYVLYGGNFNGNGKVVKGLYINNTDVEYIGLFGYTSGAVIKNVGVEDSYFSGSKNIGGVVGRNGGSLTNCYNTGTVTGSSYVGGVVGYNTGSVTNCYNTGTVTGSSYVGGVIGYNEGTSSNNYYLNTCGATGEGTSVTLAQFSSGEVAYKPNGTNAEMTDAVWKQNLDNGDNVDAAPGFTGGTVFTKQCIDVVYGYSNTKVTKNAHTTPSTWDCTAGYTCETCGATVDAVEAHTAPTGTKVCEDYTCTVCKTEVEAIADHTGNTTAVGAVDATCGKDGYTGDTVCECGETVATGTVIPATGKHTEDTAATCMTQAVCKTCGQSYGELNKKNHTGNTTTVGAVDATCGKDGYTGDTVCECGETVTTGTVIPATGKHTEGTAATCMTQAVCRTCGQSYGNTNSANHTGGTEVRGSYEATETTDGYTGDTHCKGCGTIVATGNVIPATGTDTPDTPSGDCDHLCHSDNWFMSFIWKIVRFFIKLFRTQPLCECGAAHY